MKPAAGALALALALAFSPHADALQILQSDISHTDGRYHINFDVVINARPEAVRALMTDYARLNRLSGLVVESSVSQPHASAPKRLNLLLRGCVLFYCKDVRKVDEVEMHANGDIITRAVRGAGDFTFSHERWRVLPQARQTRLRYTGSMQPAFFVPPFIGPPALKHGIRRHLTATVRKIEQLAAKP